MRFPVLIGQGSRGETAMEEHSILIADKDTNYLREISEFFTGEGYSVATTDSAVSVMCDILQKHVPVLLLGGDFDKKIGLPHLLQRKEIAMKSFRLKSFTEKISNAMIIAIVVAGTVILAFINQINLEGTLMSKLFLVFIGAIITFQLLPGLMLIGGMIKGLVTMDHRKADHEKADSSAHK
jgi:hypothetical protein